MTNDTPHAVHDLKHGHQNSCQVCNSDKLVPILDLGHLPPCDSLLSKAQLNDKESVYPLRVIRCTECGLVQIDYIVEPDVLFHPAYPYRSGITPSLARNLQETAKRICDKYNIPTGSLCMDIGSNDGTLLKGFQARGMRVLGVEATNVARIAIADGVDTVQSFFSEAVAREIVAKYGAVSAITATNMFAHVSNLGDMIRGISLLLPEGGVFVTESHYLIDILDTVQYDSIYHEHLKYYSLRPLIRLFEQYGFTVTDAERIPNYGGSIRVYAEKGHERPVSIELDALLREEDARGIYTDQAYIRFREQVIKAKLDLQEFLLRLRREGRPAPGIGCPGRSSTLLNFSNIDPELMPYIAEQSNSLKLGLYLPGTHIPVVDEQRLFSEQPEYAVILSWHYAKPIVDKLRSRGLRSKIIVPLPELHVID